MTNHQLDAVTILMVVAIIVRYFVSMWAGLIIALIPMAVLEVYLLRIVVFNSPNKCGNATNQKQKETIQFRNSVGAQCTVPLKLWSSKI